MILYSFQNFYLQGIHAGIQCQHCTAELFTKYVSSSKQSTMLHDWATNHKTTIILNAGMHKDLQELKSIFESCNHDLPWAHFNESEEALNSALTNVSIVVPDHIIQASRFQSAAQVKEREAFDVFVVPPKGANEVEQFLIDNLARYRLMS